MELVAHILLGVFLPDEENEDADMTRAWHLQRFVASFLGSIIYFGVLFKYR